NRPSQSGLPRPPTAVLTQIDNAHRARVIERTAAPTADLPELPAPSSVSRAASVSPHGNGRERSVSPHAQVTQGNLTQGNLSEENARARAGLQSQGYDAGAL